MAVVILSRVADMKNVRNDSSQSNFRLLRMVINLVMIEKPSYESMILTMVMAPIRNTSISQVSPRCSTSSLFIFGSIPKRLNIVQIVPHMSSAMAALSILILCSKAISMYPTIKISNIDRIIIYCIIWFFYGFSVCTVIFDSANFIFLVPDM